MKGDLPAVHSGTGERPEASDLLATDLLVFDASSLTCMYWNSRAREHLAYSEEALRGLALDRVVVADRPVLSAIKGLDPGDSPVFRAELRRADGTTCPVALFPRRQDRAGGQPCLLLYAADLSDVFGDLLQAQAELQTVLDGMRLLVIVKDAEGKVMRVNRTVAEGFGVSPEEMAGTPVARWWPKDEATFARGDEEIIASGAPILGVLESIVVKGQRRWVRTDKLPLRDAGGQIAGVIVLGEDVTDLIETQQALRAHQDQLDELVAQRTAELEATHAELERLALTDPLTGISNRRHLMVRLDEELRRACRYDQPLAVLLLDLDHFKDINDTHGHLVGDEMLRRAAGAATANLRDCDVKGRFGGEEFLFVLPHTDAEGAQICAERLRAQLAAERLEVGGHSLGVTCSIGIATALSADVHDPNVLINAADRALYEAKRCGRNQVRIAASLS